MVLGQVVVITSQTRVVKGYYFIKASYGVFLMRYILEARSLFF